MAGHFKIVWLLRITNDYVFESFVFLARPSHHLLKFIDFEKATKFCEISTLFLSYVVPVKSKVEIPQNFVAFSEYMNFT